MGLLNLILGNKETKYTFKNHYDEDITMSADKIYSTIMENSKDSDYNWIAPASELVKLCKKPDFPKDYATHIELAILNCFANIEERVNRGADKYYGKQSDIYAVQYCYDELGRLAKITQDTNLKSTINSARLRYLKEMIASAVNTSTRGIYYSGKAFRNLREEVIKKNFKKYSSLEYFNINAMYVAIFKETETIFREASKSNTFRAEEREAMFNIAKAFKDIGDNTIDI